MKKIAYVMFVLLNVGGLICYRMDLITKSLLEVLYTIEAPALFLICCNSFYVPRNMDTIAMLQNKQAMKTDALLIKPYLFMMVPIILCFLILIYI